MNRRHLLALGLLSSVPALGACNGTAVKKAESTGGPASAGSSGTPQASLGSATIGLTYIPNIQFAPFYLASDKGMFSQHGANVTLRHHGASEGLFNALASGQEQYVIAGADEALQALAQGTELVTVAGYYQSFPVVVIVPEGSAVKQLADLKGKKVGVPGRYGESWFGLLVALRNAGLTETDVTPVAIGYTQQAALATGKVDAIMGFSNNDVVQFRANKVAVRVIELGEVPLVSSSIITTRKQLEAQPELTRAVCRGMVGGVQAVVADPKAAVTASIPHIPGLDQAAAQQGALATLEATVPLWRGSEQVPSLQLDAARFEKMAAFMAESGLLGGTADAARAVDVSVLKG